MSELFDPQQPLFWVLVAFLGFVALLLWYGVPAAVGKMLDERADAIRKELDEARKLREDAQALLSDYQRKSREAEVEAKIIIEQAKREAEALAAESRKALAESIDRRSKLAEEKIARAETQAVSEVRATAVEAALAAAEKILKARVPGSTGDALIDQSIRDLKSKLN
jgi:F-type H+-transporting ATPase subunit b